MVSILQTLKIADPYERKARFFPALIVVLPVIVFVMSLSSRGEIWVTKLLVVGGVSGALVLALAHVASAAGNRFGEAFWKQRGGLPTQRWLRTSDKSHSSQQKQQWYTAIKRLTGLDIAEAVATEPSEEEAIISDAVRQLRYRFRGKADSKILNTHNEEYGFARNLAGLRWLMLASSLVGVFGCATAWVFKQGSVIGCAFTGFLFVYAVLMIFWLPGYVERCGIRYADSLFTVAALVLVRKSQ